MILLKADWEQGDMLQGIFAPYSLCNQPNDGKISTDFARIGTKSMRFELNNSDKVCGGSKRAELYVQGSKPVTAQLKWFAWSNYLPAGYSKDSNAECHFQIHSKDSPTAGSPLFELSLQNDGWYVQQSYNLLGTGKATSRLKQIGLADKGKWNDWVLQFEPKVDTTGIMRLWRNGKLVYEYLGANFNNVIDATTGKLIPEGPGYPKFGIYKWPWAKQANWNKVTKRVTYIDMVRMGDVNCTLADFKI